MLFRTLLFVCPAACLLAQSPPTPSAAPPLPKITLSTDEAKPQGSVPPDKVVLTIGDVKLTAAQFDQIIASLPAQFQMNARGAGRKQFADNVVRIFVLAQEARRRKLDEAAAYKTQAFFQNSNLLAGLAYEALGKNATVDAAEIQKYYDAHKGEYERVKARHILIRAQGSPLPVQPGKKDLPEAEAFAKAQEIRKKIEGGADFAELAKSESDDTTSGPMGGDLGSFGRNQMVPPFEEAAFAMKAGELSQPVKTPFGYHIIKLTEISGQSQSFESVEPQIRAELMYQKALNKFSEQAESFNNIVYEQSGSLQPAAEAFGLKVQTTDWLSREEGAKLFKSDKLMDMAFSNDGLKERRNTEAVEISPNTLVAVRVKDYKPSAPRTFDEVKEGIESYLKLEKASKLAVKKGEAALAQLRAGKTVDGLEWIPPVVVDRKNAQGLTDLAMQQTFKIDASKLPAYAGVTAEQNKGYLLVKLIDVHNTLADDEAGRKQAESELRAALASAYSSAYIASLRKQADISINNQLINSNEVR